MERCCRPLPSRQRAPCWDSPGDPDVSARVFQESKEIFTSQAISRRVNRLRPAARQFLQRVNRRKAIQPRSARHPPLTGAILDRRAQAVRIQPIRGAIVSNRCESRSIEPMDKLPRQHDPKLTGRALEHRENRGLGNAVGCRVSDKPGCGQLDRPVLPADPDMARTIVRDRTDGMPLGRHIGCEARTVEVGQTVRGSDPHVPFR